MNFLNPTCHDQFNLFLLPYAGGGTRVYDPWLDVLPAWIKPIPLELPGHGRRYKQPPLHDWKALTEAVSDMVQPHIDQPFGIFGHSMGALVGLELAHAIQTRFQRKPTWFGAAGCVAPSRRQPELNWLSCQTSEVVERLHELGGTPREILDNQELLGMLMPMLRSDFHLCGTYGPQKRRPLDTPFLVLGGTTDAASQPAENLTDWSIETTGTCRLEMIDAGHFLIETKRSIVIALVVSEIENAFAIA